jgi:hypothetical protein
MEHITKEIKLDRLKAMAEKSFGEIVKAVVDIDKEIMIVDAELHADQEKAFLELGSEQENLWGINIKPFESPDKWIEFDSMINLRPWMGNRTRGVDNLDIQKKIVAIVLKLIVI